MDRRKILMIFGGAWLAALVLTWFLYSATKAPKAEKTVAVQAAAHDMQSGTRLQKGDLKIIRVREADLPKSAITDEKQALDRPLLFPVGTNEPLTTFKIGGTAGVEGLPASIDVGMRAISVPINDSSGVSGLILPRAHVDVLFTRPGSANEAVTATILEDVVVLAIGRNTEAASVNAANNAQNANRSQTQSATLLVTPEQAQKVELAKNQGKISLALRNPLDRTIAADTKPTTSQALYPVAKPPAPAKATPKADPPKPVAPDPPPPPPPPPPKKVVDVFRGDKHSQESFPGGP